MSQEIANSEVKPNKKYLLIIDEIVRAQDLQRLKRFKIHRLDVMSLSGNWSFARKIKEQLTGVAEEISWLPSHALVNEEVKRLRKNIHKWSVSLGDLPVSGRTLKKIFRTPDKQTSTYWFTYMSEKSSLKTDLFLRVAQFQAIENQKRREEYSDLIVALSSRCLIGALKTLGLEASAQIHILRQGSWFSKGLPYAMARGSGYALRLLLRLSLAAWILRGQKRSFPSGRNLLFLTYFPYCELQAAAKGEFRNKYFLPLQEKLQKDGRSIVWLALFIFADGISFFEALRMAKKMIRNGESIYFCEEFLGVRAFLTVLFGWISQIVRYVSLRSQLRKAPLSQGISSPFVAPILMEMFDQSYVGVPAIQGMTFYQIFQNVFARWSQSSHCVYIAEMLSWEKALIRASQLKCPNIQLIGYQHTSVSINDFPYFYEKAQNGRLDSEPMPVPSTMVVSGQQLHTLLSTSPYPQLKVAEAMRLLYLNRHLKSRLNLSASHKPILLVAGSFNARETVNLISLTREAFVRIDNVEIWFKGHPSRDMKEVVKKCGFNLEDKKYRFVYGDLARFLERAWAVLASESTVCLEALAFGNHVMVPFFSDAISVCPLVGFEDFYQKISSPEDLRQAILMLRKDRVLECTRMKRDFIHHYWQLNPKLERWDHLIRDLESPLPGSL